MILATSKNLALLSWSYSSAFLALHWPLVGCRKKIVEKRPKSQGNRILQLWWNSARARRKPGIESASNHSSQQGRSNITLITHCLQSTLEIFQLLITMLPQDTLTACVRISYNITRILRTQQPFILYEEKEEKNTWICKLSMQHISQTKVYLLNSNLSWL